MEVQGRTGILKSQLCRLWEVHAREYRLSLQGKRNLAEDFKQAGDVLSIVFQGRGREGWQESNHGGGGVRSGAAGPASDEGTQESSGAQAAGVRAGWDQELCEEAASDLGWV